MMMDIFRTAGEYYRCNHDILEKRTPRQAFFVKKLLLKLLEAGINQLHAALVVGRRPAGRRRRRCRAENLGSSSIDLRRGSLKFRKRLFERRKVQVTRNTTLTDDE
jgi:hypothetical protein